MKKNDIDALSKCSVFKGTDTELFAELLASKKYDIKSYGKHESVFSPDSFQKCLAVILKGSAEVSKSTEKGILHMSELHAGNVFGMSCIFTEDEVFPTSVTAKEQLRVLFITKEQLTELFTKYPMILENYLGILSKKIHFLNKKIESFSASDATSALRAYLLDTKEKLGTNKFIIPVSYQTLSSMLSIGRTSLYRALDELEQDGFLRKNRKEIEITERN